MNPEPKNAMPSPIFWAIVAKEGLALALELAALWSPEPVSPEMLVRAKALLSKRGEDFFKP